MKPQKLPINGWINLYKPLGMSSAQAVGKVKWLLRPQKIGHAGTLDPLASGVLPLALGEGTKCVNLLMDARKTYEFSVTFGQRRSTDDAEGEVVATSSHMPTESDIRSILPRFTGEITQIPPIYSAIKIDGERAYDLARAGEMPEMKSRVVYVYALEVVGVEDGRVSGGGEARSDNSPLAGESESPCAISPIVEAPEKGISVGGREICRALSNAPLPSPPREGEGTTAPAAPPALPQFPSSSVSLPVAHFRATVSKGTYIRSLGRDMALALGSEGYISRLHRAAVGPFSDAHAISLDFIEESVHKAASMGEKSSVVLPLTAALDDIPALAISGAEHHRLRSGQSVVLAKPIAPAPLMAALCQGQLVALVRCDGRVLVTVRVLNV